MLAGLVAGVLAGIYILRPEPTFWQIFKPLTGVLAGASAICIIGVVDDIIDIKPWQKILGQVLSAMVLVLVGIRPTLHYFTDPFNWTMPLQLELFSSSVIVIVFMLGATNSLNLLDGLDGLCGGVTAVITVAMLLLSIHLATWGADDAANPVRIIVCLGLVGSVCGFLPFNRHPAKIFMGDAGSLLLGFVLAAMMMLFAAAGIKWLLSSIVIFGLPILDTAIAFVRRWLNNRPLFISDRGHIYDQMIDRGMSLKKAVRSCYILAGFYALAGLAISLMPLCYGLAATIAIAIISAIAVAAKGYLRMEGLRGEIKK